MSDLNEWFDQQEKTRLELERERRHYTFVILAMAFYTIIMVSAFVTAVLIARENVLAGVLLFVLSLFMRFEFKPNSEAKLSKTEQETA